MKTEKSPISEARDNFERVTSQVEERCREYALIPAEQRDMSISIYRQACLLDALHLPKHYIFSYRIVMSDDKKSYQLVKRSQPLEPIDFTLEDRHDVSGKMPTFSERSGFDSSFKCHDHDDVLWNALNCTVEMKELM